MVQTSVFGLIQGETATEQTNKTNVFLSLAITIDYKIMHSVEKVDKGNFLLLLP